MSQTNVMHTAQEWEEIKPVFLYLYLEQSKSLVEVIRILADKYDFYTSEKACKKHITKWQAFKNYKASEKEELAKAGSTSQLQHQAAGPDLIRGKPVKWDRVHRHTRMKLAIEHRSSTQRDHANSTIFNDESRHIQGRLVETPTNYLELRLGSVKQYLQWQFAMWLSHPRNDRKVTPSVYSYFWDALCFLRSPLYQSRGWQLVHKGCEILQKNCTRLNLYDAMQALISFLTFKSWRDHQRLAAMVFSYIRNILLSTLPEEHPFKEMLSRITNSDDLQAIACQMSTLRLDLLTSYQSALSSKLLVRFVMDSVDMITLTGDLDRAERHLVSLSKIPTLSPLQRVALLDYQAYWRCLNKRFDLAITIHGKAISMCERLLKMEDHGEELNLLACMTSRLYRSIAHTQEVEGSINDSLVNYQKAFETSLRLLENSREESRFYYAKLYEMGICIETARSMEGVEAPWRAIQLHASLQSG